jgi:hypothetical protein
LKPETAETREALANIEYMRGLIEQTRAGVASGYGFFLLWGTVWVAGYLTTAFIPASTGQIVWAPLVVLGTVGSARLVMRLPKDHSVVPSLGARLGWMNLVLVGAFIGAPFLLGAKFSYMASVAYIPAAVGVIYVVNGMFVGREMILIGAWLVIAAVASMTMGPTVQPVWMAIAGGGSLILTGVLLRRQLVHGRGPSSGLPVSPRASARVV